MLRPIPLNATGFCFSLGFASLLGALDMMGVENALIIQHLLALAVLSFTVGIFGLLPKVWPWFGEPRIFGKGAMARENRALLSEALVECSREGLLLLRDPDYYEVDVIEEWERRTSKLIAEALGQDEAAIFLINDSISIKGSTPLSIRAAHRMHRLGQLIDRVDSAEPLEFKA